MIVKRENFTKDFKSQMETSKQTTHTASSLLKRVKSGSSQLTPDDLSRATLLGKTHMWGLSLGFLRGSKACAPQNSSYVNRVSSSFGSMKETIN